MALITVFFILMLSELSADFLRWKKKFCPPKKERDQGLQAFDIVVPEEGC